MKTFTVALWLTVFSPFASSFGGNVSRTACSNCVVFAIRVGDSYKGYYNVYVNGKLESTSETSIEYTPDHALDNCKAMRASDLRCPVAK